MTFTSMEITTLSRWRFAPQRRKNPASLPDEKNARMHTREGGGGDSRQVVDLTRNCTIQSPLVSRSEKGEEEGEDKYHS